jgi:hypothetical protein
MTRASGVDEPDDQAGTVGLIITLRLRRLGESGAGAEAVAESAAGHHGLTA